MRRQRPSRTRVECCTCCARRRSQRGSALSRLKLAALDALRLPEYSMITSRSSSGLSTAWHHALQTSAALQYLRAPRATWRPCGVVPRDHPACAQISGLAHVRSRSSRRWCQQAQGSGRQLRQRAHSWPDQQVLSQFSTSEHTQSSNSSSLVSITRAHLSKKSRCSKMVQSAASGRSLKPAAI